MALPAALLVLGLCFAYVWGGVVHDEKVASRGLLRLAFGLLTVAILAIAAAGLCEMMVERDEDFRIPAALAYSFAFLAMAVSLFAFARALLGPRPAIRAHQPTTASHSGGHTSPLTNTARIKRRKERRGEGHSGPMEALEARYPEEKTDG